MNKNKVIIWLLIAAVVVIALLAIGYQRRHNELVAQEAGQNG